MGIDRRAFHTITYGLYVVTSSWNGKFNGQIANTVFQVTSEPPKLAVCLNKENLTHEFVKNSRVFGVSVLSKDTPFAFIGLFGFRSGREVDKFAQLKSYEIGKLGVPLVTENALSVFELKVTESVDVGTHTIFVGEVVDSKVILQGEPLTYDYYHKVKGGISPKRAPTYSEEIVGEEVITMKRYVCKVCGYAYDPAKGDPDHGIAPGTSFEELPDDWVCPVCGATKSEFEPVE